MLSFVVFMIAKGVVDSMSAQPPQEILEMISDPSAKRRAIEDAIERFVFTDACGGGHPNHVHSSEHVAPKGVARLLSISIG